MPLTLACVLDRVNTTQQLSKPQGRDVQSALRTVARSSGRPLETIEASVPAVRKILDGVLPARHGLSRSRWANIRSLVLKALDIAGVPRRPGRCRQRPSPAWQQCLEPLADKPYRIVLLPLARYCTRLGIEPSQVHQEAFEGFAREREDLCGRARPRETYRSTCRIWNMAVQAYPHMPRVQVDLDDRKQRYSFPWSYFPGSFRQDVEAMAQAAASPDPLDVNAHKPLRNATVEGRRRACRALASALVLRGRAPDTIRSISDLVEAEAAKGALRFFLERTGKRPSAYLRDLARLLCSLARHWVYARHPARTTEEEEAREVNLKMLDGLRKRLEPDRSGMTEKNRSALRHFDDDQMFDRLLALPARIWRDHARGHELKMPDLIRLQVAMAIEILTVFPIRRKNLVEMRIDRNLVPVGSGKCRRLHLYFARKEVKNETEIERELPPETAAMLDRYLNEVRPLLQPGQSPYLFVGRGGSHKSAYLLSKQIADLTAAELGVRLTAHQFRHIAGYLCLKSNPGSHEVVRQLLGHTRIDTTIKFYAGMETAEAFRYYDSLVTKLRVSPGLPAARGKPRAGGSSHGV
jgi:integrase